VFTNISANLQRQNRQEEYEHGCEPRFCWVLFLALPQMFLRGLGEVPPLVCFSVCLKGGLGLYAGELWGFPKLRSTEGFRCLILIAKSTACVRYLRSV